MPMMKCGCAAQGTCSRKDGVDYNPPIPSRLTHDCTEIAETRLPDGRTARCTYYGKQPRKNECDQCRKNGVCQCEKPSSPDLAFFVFQGEASPYATEICKCGMHKIAHRPTGNCKCQNFVAQGPAQHDRYYCGCKGWD